MKKKKIKKLKPLKYTVTLTVGDWSADGHGQTYDYVIKSSLSAAELQRAYRAGVKKTKVDVSKYCADYQDNLLPKKELELLIKSGMEPENYLDSYDESDIHGVHVWSEDFPLVWLFIAEVGAPSFRWKEAGSDSINIGGYGLFA